MAKLVDCVLSEIEPEDIFCTQSCCDEQLHEEVKSIGQLLLKVRDVGSDERILPGLVLEAVRGFAEFLDGAVGEIFDPHLHPPIIYSSLHRRRDCDAAVSALDPLILLHQLSLTFEDGDEKISNTIITTFTERTPSPRKLPQVQLNVGRVDS